MTDTIRDLLISLSSHMAYMQGQLEARHELDDFEDFYWCRESVLLRQKVTDALADEPAVPQPQPPAEGEVEELVVELRMMASQAAEACQFTDAENLSRAADLLQRLSPPQPVPVSERPPEDQLCWWFEPDEEDDEAYGSSWTLLRICGGTSSYTHRLPAHALPIPHQQEDHQ